MAKKCWEMRGCDEEMQTWCPHAMLDTVCPVDCQYSQCARPSHKQTLDPDLMLDPTVDRRAAQREQCVMCEFFLKNGPRLVASSKP